MQLNNWKIFDKNGSQINWLPDPYIPLNFASDVSAAGASGYLITDPSGYAVDAEITNSGFYYLDPVTVSYTYALDETDDSYDITADVSISYVDVSIFNPNPITTKGIGSLSITTDISVLFAYPSATYSAAIYLEPVSQGLIETEHLYIFEEINSSLVRPYDVSYGSFVFQMVGEEDTIQFFVVDDDTQEITWVDTLEYDLDTWAPSTPLTLNIGFRSDDEGVYERRLRIYNVIDGLYYLMAEIIVNAESIGEDERFRTLLTNFGLPDPKDIPHIFKETDINEDLPDYKIINPKSKHMILEHDHIIPYIGTYKGLINAIKWLGYDDIYIKEWFKNVKENRKLSLVVPYDAADRTQTILKFSPDERKALKKLNQLSLVYCITKETGEIDDWGTPETENCFEYNLKEVFVKLLGLKNWLERNIIGVNARIIDLTGEGIYFERYINLVYAIGNQGYVYKDSVSLTPFTDPNNSELVAGEASINMSLKELSRTNIGSLPYRFSDFIDYVWNPLDPSVTLSPLDPSYLADPSAYLEVGPPLAYPFVSIKDIMWKASVEKPDSGVLQTTHVTNPLWIYDNTIQFYNIFDTSTIFYDSSINLDIVLEKAYIVDGSGNNWLGDNQYYIYPDPDPSSYGGYIMESSTGTTWMFNDYVALNTDTSALLQYAVNDTYRVPLLSFKNFKTDDASENQIPFEQDKLYHLDILDGKIVMNNLGSTTDGDIIYYINFSYDYSTFEQTITLNVEYYSQRMPLYVIDPSIYYWADPSHLSGGGDPSIFAVDNSIYTMTVNHIGDYHVEAFAWDGYNVMFTNPVREGHEVWVKTPTIYTLLKNKITSSYAGRTLSAIEIESLLNSNFYPIFDRDYPYMGLSMLYDSSDNIYLNAPSITYFNGTPESGSIDKFYTASEQVIDISGNDITFIKRYEDFLIGDDITLLQTYKGSYIAIAEASSYITNVVSDVLSLDNIPGEFVVDTSHSMYILNNTNRATYNSENHPDTSTFTTDISVYLFLENQLVNLLVTDPSGHQWGASYRVEDVSGSIHTFTGLMPQFIIDASDRYTIQARHAYSAFANYEMITDSAQEVNNNFEIYLEKDYRQYFIDSTFVMLNIVFDQEYTFDQWYNGTAQIELLTDWTNHGFNLFNSSGTEIDQASNYGGSPSDYCQSNTFNVSGGTTIDISINYYNGGGLPRPTIPLFYIQELGGDDPSTEYTIIKDQGYWYQNNFVHTLDPSTTSAYLRFVDGSTDYDMSWKAGTSVLGPENITKYYYHDKPINIPVDTHLIIKAEYDSSTYMLGHKNIFTVKENISKDIVFRVHNQSVPFVFDTSGYYDVIAEAYDIYGNLSTKTYEGLINVT